MKNLIIAVLLIGSTTIINAQTVASINTNENNNLFASVDVKSSETKKEKTIPAYKLASSRPKFPGGQSALQAYLAKEVEYPTWAAKNGSEGVVLVQAKVNVNGTLSNVKVVSSEDSLLDPAAIKAVEAMPKWEPAIQTGRTVSCKVTIPVAFSLR